MTRSRMFWVAVYIVGAALAEKLSERAIREKRNIEAIVIAVTSAAWGVPGGAVSENGRLRHGDWRPPRGAAAC